MMKRPGISPVVLLFAAWLSGGNAWSEVGSISGLAPFPGAAVEAQQPAHEVQTHSFVLGAVERTGGAMRARHALRVGGQLQSTTYRIVGGFSPDEVRKHYRTQMVAAGFEILFECGARACGKSTVWANSVFRQSVLYGPDSNQRYLAARRPGPSGERLAAVYVTQRGNRQVFAHVEVVTTADATDIGAPDALLTLLAAERRATLAGVVPAADGELDGPARDMLRATAEVLGASEIRGMFVVCHIYGSPAADALGASQRCAEEASGLLDPDGELGLAGFGAGPYAPQARHPQARIELILP